MIALLLLLKALQDVQMMGHPLLLLLLKMLCVLVNPQLLLLLYCGQQQ
jgi:hypothetical protein